MRSHERAAAYACTRVQQSVCDRMSVCGSMWRRTCSSLYATACAAARGIGCGVCSLTYTACIAADTRSVSGTCRGYAALGQEGQAAADHRRYVLNADEVDGDPHEDKLHHPPNQPLLPNSVRPESKHTELPYPSVLSPSRPSRLKAISRHRPSCSSCIPCPDPAAGVGDSRQDSRA